MTSDQVQLDERGMPPGYRFRADWEVTPRQVKAMLDEEADFMLLDCRLPQEHQHARIEGATLLPMQQLPARIAELEAHRERKIVVYCHHGGRSLQVAGFLRQQGFSDVTSMAGGIHLWSFDIDPTVPRY